MITSAAIQLKDGLTLTMAKPARYKDIIAEATRQGIDTSAELTYGFLGEKGTFLDRKAAAMLAHMDGQITAEQFTSAMAGKGLTTADLW